jgi:hypothetical protein
MQNRKIGYASLIHKSSPLRRSNSCLFLEEPGKMILIFEAETIGNFLDRKIALFE